MQNNNHNATISVSQPTIIQVAKSNSTALLQNGQHLLIGKIEPNNANSSVDNQSGSSSSNAMQTIYPLQYIETAVANNNSNQTSGEGNNIAVYASASNKIFYQDGHAPGIYTGQTATIIPASTIQARDLSSHLAANIGSTVHIQGAQHTQILHHGGNAYLVQSATKIEDESPNLSHTTKASPVTVQWLCDNYETADGVSLPRSTLYNHYLQHCQQEKLEPMNQASFGKLIRSVFYGLRTRRLGTRGNSKYHYYGIRIKPNSLLNHYVEDQTFAMRQYPSFHRQSNDDFHWRNKYSSHGLSYGTGSFSGNSISNNNNSQTTGNTNTTNNNNSILIMNNNSNPIGECGTNNQHSNFLGESSSALPNLSEIIARAELDTLTEDDCLQEGVTLEDINIFCQMYLDHSDAVLSAVVYLNFKYIETLWQEFWRTSVKVEFKLQSNHLEEKLPKVQLHRLLKIPQIQSFLQLFDNMFYQSLVEVLIPNVLRPIPSALTQNIRHFAKSLESWMQAATCGLNAEVIQIKMNCVCALAQTLRRHTSLNHLAQAARAVLKNASQISQMLTDLNRVDFNNVQEQASWVCGCDNKRVDALQQEFKRILQQQASLEEWATWLDHVVSDVLEPFKGTSQYPNAAHQFILKWSFYSSMVIRDLTLRSAASFGSFHLIRLLYDEYIYYLVEQKVAEHLNLSPVAVTGEMGRQLMAADCGSYGQLHHLHMEMDESTRAESGKQPFKFKVEQAIKKEGDSVGGAGVKLGGQDYGTLMSYGSGPGSNPSRLASGVDMDYTRMSGANSITAGDSNQSGYNNSSAMTDDQVDESADDDEGLDEDFQSGEPLPLSQLQSESKSGLSSGQPVILSVPLKKPDSTTTQSPATQLVTGRNPTSGTGGGITVRKTVNVTTFGDPQTSNVAASLSSSGCGTTNVTDVPLTALNKINVVNNSTSGIVALPSAAVVSATNSAILKTFPTISSTVVTVPGAPPNNSKTVVTLGTLPVISTAPSETSSITTPIVAPAATTTNISIDMSSGVSSSKRIKLVNSNSNSNSACSITANSVTGTSSF